MKVIVITVFVCLLGTLSSLAQCPENAVFTASKTSLSDPYGNPSGIKDEKTTLTFSKSAIRLNIDGKDRGDLKIMSQTCNWTTPYKVGKSVIKASMNESDYILTIEGIDGKVILTAVKQESDDSIIKLTADKFEGTAHDPRLPE
jgi:hypothetical protein